MARRSKVRRLVAVVGIPPQVAPQFSSSFSKLAAIEQVELATLSAYGLHLPYTADYAKEVYGKIARKLQGRQRQSRETLLSDTNLIALFLQKPCESHRVLLDTFGVEALATPMLVSDLDDMPMETRSQRGQVIRRLIRNARHAIRHARKMLEAVHDELNGRENKTSLLLPPKTFGNGFQRVQQCVWRAAAERQDTGRFVEGLKGLPINKRERHYEGQSGLVFKSPSKAGPRHGLPPVWNDGHEPSCVIRGRLRFGAPYDPRFHYDCEIQRDSHRQFPGCHEPIRLQRSRKHANCAPNDGVR